MRTFASIGIAILSAFAFASSSSGLTHSQLAKLRKVGHVVIPTYIPPHFRVTKVTTDKGEYDIEYAGPHGAELTVQMASEGLGDIPIGVEADEKTLKSTTLKVHNPVFGTQSMDVATAKNAHEFAVNWVDLGEKANPRDLSIIGRNMSAAVGAKIWQGLRFLR